MPAMGMGPPDRHRHGTTAHGGQNRVSGTPKVVTAAMDELGWRAKWIGSYTREDTTAPIPELPETAQQLKLLRKHRGQLLLTKTGAALRDDPEALRRHLAQFLPPTPLWWTWTTDGRSHHPGSRPTSVELITVAL